ncbi:MAG: hypothetical protein IT340_12295 [Chloroflexi bacterium]|nr:hypothetical protein [Chloroflexota bacterium]
MSTTDRPAAISIATPLAPPYWALLQRELIRAQSEACLAFYARYFDERGYLLCVPRWGGNDGPDDAAENLLNWPMLHALGAPDAILERYRHGWEGHLRQYTEARTVDVPLARDGMYYKEFPTMFDWFHNGEGFSPFFLQGLSDPHDAGFVRRTRRFAGFYMGDDPQADNYDPRHRIIRSMFNGSRGPLLRKATALDWAGDPIEVEGRFSPLHNERTFEEMLAHFRDYTDIVGDHPLNLGATTLAFNAYALTGEARYRDWVLEYVDAWVERTEANGGIIPSNIGLDGTIGGECGGRWWGGTYGWGFTVDVIPYTGERAHRGAQFQNRAAYGFGNALLLSGNQRYVEVWRRMIDLVNANAKEVDGRRLYPHMYGTEEGPEGWYHFTPQPFAPGALELYTWSLDRSALDLLPSRPRWTAYLDGDDPAYPVDALQADLDLVRRRAAAIAADDRSPDTTMSDDMNDNNPATIGALNRLMLGGLPTGREGYPLHCRLRYFDPARRRAGIPEDVAALVDSLTADSVAVTLVNTSQTTARTVIVQGGGYAEHQLTSATVDGTTTPVDGSHVTVHLAPGAGGRLVLGTRRYANHPTFAFPWS